VEGSVIWWISLRGEREQVPDTHEKAERPGRGVERFFSRIDLLGSKLGPILFQLPPRWEIDCDRLRVFLEALSPGNRYAFEFRDPSWHTESVYKLLAKFQAAYCIFDLAGFQSPLRLTADFTYIRPHWPRRKYESTYEDSRLRSWAKRLKEWDLTAAYVFFDNDQAAFAVQDATRLRAFLTRV
jgi:uncharacterized protein YecE (DUF72 family)